MAIARGKTRCIFTLDADNAKWIADWLKRNGAPRVMLSQMVDDYLVGIRHTIEELEKSDGKLTLADIFRISGGALEKVVGPDDEQ